MVYLGLFCDGSVQYEDDPSLKGQRGDPRHGLGGNPITSQPLKSLH